MTESRVYPERSRGVAAASLSLLLAGCGGLTGLPPTAPSTTFAPQSTVTAPAPTPAAPAPTHAVGPDVPAGLTSTTRMISGSVGPLRSEERRVGKGCRC